MTKRTNDSAETVSKWTWLHPNLMY